MGRRVVVIGGGPAGIAAVRALLGESPEFDILVLESRHDFGGLWNYSPTKGPMYRNLEANVPRDLLGFANFPFPGHDSDETYPSRQEVLSYIRSYSIEVTRNKHVRVQFNSKVTSVTKDKNINKWVIVTDKDETFLSDLLLLSTGHYEFPLWPPIPGLREHPGALHSVDYDVPEEFLNKKLLMIGNSRSGTDIAIQLLSTVASITISRRKEGPLDHIFDEAAGIVTWKPEVEKIIGRAVYFQDGSCEVFDRILNCTGYLYDFPFLKNGQPAISILEKDRSRLQGLYKHTIFAGDPTLATLGMNKGMVPFPTFETQGAVIARIWNGRLKLPELNVMIEEEAQTLRDRGAAEKFHDLPMLLDIDFMKLLWDWADEASGGFKAERWDPKKLDRRKDSVEAKLHQDIANLRVSLEARNKRLSTN